MKPIIIALLLAGTAWGQPLIGTNPTPQDKSILAGREVEWDQYSPDPHRPGYYCAFKHKKLLTCGLPALAPIAPHPDPDIIFSDKVNYPCRAPEPSANYGCEYGESGPYICMK